MNNIAMQLRKCCNHPFLLDNVETIETESGICKDMSELQSLIETSGKISFLDKMLPKLRDEGHRVLIFSQMTSMLNILEDYLRLKSFGYERIDGNVQGIERQNAIDRFNSENSKSFVFLISTKAGGVGINLTSADTVVIYDSDWNPQNDLQAMARCHRIGQKSQVSVYRLLSRKTYEMAMFERASMKLGLDRAVRGVRENISQHFCCQKYSNTTYPLSKI